MDYLKKYIKLLVNDVSEILYDMELHKEYRFIE